MSDTSLGVTSVSLIPGIMPLERGYNQNPSFSYKNVIITVITKGLSIPDNDMTAYEYHIHHLIGYYKKYFIMRTHD